MADRRRDFTQGSIPGHLVAFALPMLLGNLLQALYSTIDSIWVGRFLGPDALAAVSVGAPIIFALIALVTGLTMATTVLVSQYAGARQHDQVVRTINNSLVILAVAGALVSLAGVVFRRPMLAVINTPPEIMDMASAFLGVYMVGLLGSFIFNAVGAILRGLGDSRTPLIFLCYAVAVNIACDPLFIFGLGPIPRLDVAGAALASTVAQTFSAIIALRYLYRSSGIFRPRPAAGRVDAAAADAPAADAPAPAAPGRFGAFRLDWQLTGLTFKIGLPSGLQQVLVSMSALVVSSIVNHFGYEAVAGFGAGGRLDQFAFLPVLSVGLAVSALVGQNLGAGETQRVRETVKWATLLSGGIALVMALANLIVAPWMLVLFTKDPVVIAQGAAYLRFVAIGYVPLALMFALAGVIRGAGDTVPTMIFSFLSLWVVRLPLAHFLSAVPALGIHGVWLAIAASSYAGVVIYYLYYRTGRWQARAVVRRRPDRTPESGPPGPPGPAIPLEPVPAGGQAE